jgi:hypothetical protein
VSFDLNRADLLECLKTYAREELNGGTEYTFLEGENCSKGFINARTALDNYNRKGINPLTKWQTHMFKYAE